MAKNIALTELKVFGMFVDIINQRVTVNYSMHDADGKNWIQGQQVYWVTLPVTPEPTDSQLPAQYLANLTGLYNAAKADLTAKYLV